MKRVCVLTGASGQLGTVFCRALADRYNIVAVYREHEPDVAMEGRELFDPLDPAGTVLRPEPTVFGVRADLTDEFDRERIVELTLARFGGLDLLVNGAVHSQWGNLVESEQLVRDAELQFEVNVIVPLQLSTLFARRFWRNRAEMNRSRRRGVVNISSAAGRIAFLGSGQGIYAASKAALEMLTRHMAHEFATFGVRVNAVSPDTFPSRVATNEVAQAIVTLDDGDASGTIVELP